MTFPASPTFTQTTSAPVLAARDLDIGYKASRGAPKVIVPEMQFSLLPGELVCLIGPNGVGKSTLLRTIAGMQPPLKGTLRLSGDEVADLAPLELARRLAIVLTERVDGGLLTAEALVGLGRHPHTDWSGWLNAQDEAVIHDALVAVGALELAHRRVSELSDGERQKVMIARALAQQPVVMLLDEPTAFLDLPRRVEMMRVLRTLARKTDCAVLLSTHDLDLALRSADRLWVLQKGGPLTIGAPEDLVLEGVLARVFAAEGVEFVPETGSFRLNSAPRGEVALRGEQHGLAFYWTQRALERAGYTIRADAAVVVTVGSVSEGTEWYMDTHDGTTAEFASLYALIAALQVLPH
ncbi:MAG: ABC transporter ATP-binding protein [bacterium]|nr:ABC transporter ATP-binding protein [bacterium]